MTKAPTHVSGSGSGRAVEEGEHHPERAAADGGGRGVDERAEVNPLGAPQFPVLTEQPHPAEFILSEATGSRSRDNAYLAGAVTIKVGQPLQRTAAPTTDQFATYVAAASAANCDALAIYGGTGDSVNGLKIAVLARDAEVNGKLIPWGAIDAFAASTQLATKGIVVR